LVSRGAIKPLCDILQSMDNKLIQVALDGLENILKVGEEDRQRTGAAQNDYAVFVEECGGMELIHQLQMHDNVEIYKKAYHIIDKYFGGDEDDGDLAPEVDQQTGTFTFPSNATVPQGGFSFGQ
jgi:hypothetical protein